MVKMDLWWMSKVEVSVKEELLDMDKFSD